MATWLLLCGAAAFAQVPLSSALAGDAGTGDSPKAAPRPESEGFNIGTAFVVGDGYLLTAFHVVRGNDRLLVGPVAQGRWVAAEVVKTDATQDLALLKALVNMPALSLTPSADLPTGLEVVVIGYPHPRVQGLARKVTQGLINGSRNERDRFADVGQIQISAEIANGNSGGPVFSPDGLVIGMVQHKLDARKVEQQTQDLPINVSYALRSSQLLRFLQGTPVVPRVQGMTLDTVLRPYQIFERSQASVLAVIARAWSTRTDVPARTE